MARVINQTDGTVLAERAIEARNWWRRGVGLLGRRGLPEGEGLIINPCSSIHTFFMAFPIDVAFVAVDGRVIATAHALKPWRLGPFARKVRYVVELPAGVLARTGTGTDDYLTIDAGDTFDAPSRPSTSA